MGQFVNPEIQVDGNTILEGATYDISIHHQMAEHSRFSISCPSEALEGPDGILAEKTKQFIGSGITIKFNDGVNIFVGIITNVSINKFDASSGNIIISGYSPTIQLENGKDCKSFEEKKLEEIIKETFKGYPTDKLKFESKPFYTKKLLYTVQYKESDFDFIRRLSCRYGEWFYYDGQKIIIGKVDDEEKKLQYGKDLHQLSFSMNSKPQDHLFVAYDFVKADDYTKSQQDFKETISNPYIKDVMKSSNKIFTKKPQSIYNHLLMEEDGKAQFEDVVKNNLKNTINVIQLTAVSDEVTLNVGNRIKITGDNLYTLGKEDDYGSYIITDILHECSSMGDYENRFTAVPTETKIPLYFNSSDVPYAEKQSATVTDNADPKGLGRVRVQFAWQKSSKSKTPWIRVLSSSGGGDKGFYFIPEKGEEVLVDFESGNAEKPYVGGTHYNGKAKATKFGNKNNDLKVIQTRGGHVLKFDDTQGSESITITDKNGNMILFDTKNNGITITSVTSISIRTDAFSVNANTIALSGEQIVINASEELNMTSEVSGLNGSNSLKLEGSTIALNAKSTLSAKSENEANLIGKTTNVQGDMMVNIN